MRILNRIFPVLYLFAPALILTAVSTAYAGGFPHYLQNEIDCTDCHNVHGDQPQLIWEQPVQADIDHSPANQLCWSCHNDSDAHAVVTHSSLQTGNQYGNWTVDCVVCHDPHFPLQVMNYPNDYIAQGVVAAVDATTLTKTGPADWVPDAFKGMTVFPDRNRVFTSYRIAGNTADTLIIDADVSTPQVDGSMDLLLVGNGDTFLVSYGRLIRNRVDLGRIQEYLSTDPPLPEPSSPKGGIREVKFIRPSGANSYADGDAEVNGICEVCHTLTSQWLNDGTLANTGVHAGLGGGKCIICHKHTDGFAPFSHLTEGSVVPTSACTACHETSSPIAAVHGNSCGRCHVNSDGGGALVEPYETERPSGGQCSDCHSAVTGSHDEISHTATPGQGWVLIFEQGDHDDVMTWDGEVLVDCNRCHTMNLKAAHAQLCSNCHASPADSFATWNGGCQQGGCHTSYHTESNVVHFPFDNNDDCTLCHNSGDWSVPQANCSNCHASPGSGPPVTTSNAQATYTGTAGIDFSITIGGKVGVGFTFYLLDGGPEETGSNLTVSEPGAHTLEFWTVGQTGQVETPHKTASFTILEDTEAPVTTSNAQAAYDRPVLITLTATDNDSMGVKTTYYKLNGGPTQTSTSVYVAQQPGRFSYTLDFWSDDWSGNVEEVNTVNFDVIGGTGTLSLVWGDSDTTGSPCPGDPDAYVAWEIRRGSYLVSEGYSECPWNGVNDITVPVSFTSYYVDIFWWDSSQGFEEITEYPNVSVENNGDFILLRY